MRNVSRESFKENQEKQTVLFAQARLLSSLVAATLNLLVIVLLNKLYEYVALWLVNWEQPRTQTEFEHSYTFKMFLFQFINFYLPLIYIALFKVSFRSPPSPPSGKGTAAGEILRPAWQHGPGDGGTRGELPLRLQPGRLRQQRLLLRAEHPADGGDDGQTVDEQRRGARHTVNIFSVKVEIFSN